MKRLASVSVLIIQLAHRANIGTKLTVNVNVRGIKSVPQDITGTTVSANASASPNNASKVWSGMPSTATVSAHLQTYLNPAL